MLTGWREGGCVDGVVGVRVFTGRSGVEGVLHYKQGWGYGVYRQWRFALSRGTQYVGTSGSTPAPSQTPHGCPCH